MAEIPAPSVPAPPRPAGDYDTVRSADDSRRVAGLYIPGSSVLYTILGFLQLVAGIVALIAPYKLTDVFFRGALVHTDVLYEELWRIVAAVLFAGAATSYALKVASDRRQLADPLTQRLQVGGAAWSLLVLVLLVVHLFAVRTLTWKGALLGAVVSAPALLLPTVHLGLSGGFGLAAAANGVRIGLRNLFAPGSSSVAGFLYTLLTVLFTVGGAVIVVLPKRTLDWTFGYHAGSNPTLLWQIAGGAAVFLFSAITYTLTERSVAGRLHLTIPKVLNVGLLIAALFHVLEFGTLLVNRQGPLRKRWLLPVLAAHWIVTLLTSILGLSASPPAPAYEYEALATDPITTV